MAGADAFRVSAAGICLNPQNQMLVLKHRFREENPWGLPGGLLKRGEGPTDGLIREIREETGLEPTVEDIISAHGEGEAIHLIYLLRVPAAEPDLQEGEIRDYRWVPLANHDLTLSPAQEDAVERVAKRLHAQRD